MVKKMALLQLINATLDLPNWDVADQYEGGGRFDFGIKHGTRIP